MIVRKRECRNEFGVFWGTPGKCMKSSFPSDLPPGVSRRGYPFPASTSFLTIRLKGWEEVIFVDLRLPNQRYMEDPTP